MIETIKLFLIIINIGTILLNILILIKLINTVKTDKKYTKLAIDRYLNKNS